MKTQYTLPLSDPQATLETVGGKGASLMRLMNAGLPVPDGFHVTTAAYHHFVEQNNLQAEIEKFLTGVDLSQPKNLETVSQKIIPLFTAAPIPDEIANAIVHGYAALPGNHPPVAVRSSATAEDLPEASFAGQQETYLNVSSPEAVLEATRKCWASLWTARAISYRAQQHIAVEGVALAVVIQLLIPAEAAGILFTANPINSQRDQMMVSTSWGLGEAVVGGLVTPDTLTLEKPSGTVIQRETAQKLIQTVRINGGTEEIRVPESLQKIPVLNDEQAAELGRLGLEIENLYDMPMDIEWALVDGQFAIVQARPITTLIGEKPVTKEWNATFKGNYLWTNMIVGEVFPTATTLSTWSVWQDYFSMLSMGDIPTIERIAGRPYLNYSLMYSFLMKIMRKHERVMSIIKDSVGVPPIGVEVPPFPVSWKTVLLQVIPHEIRNEMKKTRLRKKATEFLAMVRKHCQEFLQRIKSASGEALIALWKMEIRPLWKEIHPLQDKTNEELNLQTRKLKADLTKLLGSEEANALLTTINSAGELASLGPLVGIVKVRSGELSREEYLQRYGHRGPQENELAEPRPYEDPGWLDRQLAEFATSPVDVMALLENRKAEFDTVQERILKQLPPKQVRDIARRINETVESNTLREATRSELTRLVGVIRAFFLRAGEITGLGEDVFFLTVDELIDHLSGDPSAAPQIPARRDTYEQYRALTHLPPWIRGHFEPLKWSIDPGRRLDVFDLHAPMAAPIPSADFVINGYPGSAGTVDGIVQRIDSPDQGDQLQVGEILVTGMTNVGWTPLFPRAAAVVTDFGGSLSHAAIVARELGIPAVVGCRDATTRLKTGDRVRVDGGTGTVTILQNGHKN